MDKPDLKPLLDFKALPKQHKKKLNNFSHKNTNAVTEELNNKIQPLKASDKGVPQLCQLQDAYYTLESLIWRFGDNVFFIK